MTRMVFSMFWSFVTALICLLNQGNLVWGRCTDNFLQIGALNYTLSNKLEEGSILTYQCEEGFYPYPYLSRVCDYKGTWQPPRKSRCKQVQCPDPNVYENCNVLPIKPEYFYQDKITYECYDGYSLYGPTSRTCLSSGKWSNSHPVCRRESGDQCPDPGIPPGASRTGSLFDLGETVTYKCNSPNMILIGSEERVCQEDSSWSGNEPTCYYQHTYDTPLEVSHAFGGRMKDTFAFLETESNVTQKMRRMRLSENGIFNIYIALDVSSSIRPEDFEMAKKAVETLIDKISIFSVTPNYDVVFFSSQVFEVIDIVSFFGPDKEPLIKLVNRLKSHKIPKSKQSGTNLKKVFAKFNEKMGVIKQQQANFKDHHHTIIVFTDGQINMGGKPNDEVKELKATVLMGQEKERKEHLDIYIFGIGDKVYDANLQGLTYGTGGQHYFRLRNLGQLHEAFDEIINEEDIKGLCGLYRDYTYGRQSESSRWKYPWAVSIQVIIENLKTSDCLGSLVSPRFVLTAAHCFTVDGLISNITVDYDGNQLDVANHTVHPLYNVKAKQDQGIAEFYDYDVALLELKKDVEISASLRPICLPCTEGTSKILGKNLNCTEQRDAVITHHQRINFVSKKEKGRKSLNEKHAHIKIQNRPDCINKALLAPGMKYLTPENVSNVVTKNFLCTGGIEPEGDQISCPGDSGGAVFKNYLNRTIQVALVSWGNTVMPECNKKKIPQSNGTSRDFHINLFQVVPFLRSILGNTNQTRYKALEFIK